MAEPVESKVINSAADEEIINNLELLLNFEVLQESDIWDDLTDLVKIDMPDESSLPESEKR